MRLTSISFSENLFKDPEQHKTVIKSVKKPLSLVRCSFLLKAISTV